MARRSSVFDDVDPGLAAALEAVSGAYKPHRVEVFSGRAPRPKNPSSLHPLGRAMDVNLYDRQSGAMLPNIGDPSSAAPYQAFANEVYKWALANDPELAKELIWGGYFQGGSWPRDFMHFQRGGQAAGGSWAGGFDPAYVKAAGLSGAGGLGDLAGGAKADAILQAAGYTPEQRRNAIAAIESGGAGSYGTVGAEADPAGHRARGRYGVMDYNIGPWAEQYLKMKGVTVEQFMASPELQDQLFDAVFGSYVTEHGERGAASKWFTGSPDEPRVTDVHGRLTGKSYADAYIEQLTRGGKAAIIGDTNRTSVTPGATPPTAPAAEPKSKLGKLGEAVGAGLGKMPAPSQASYQVPPTPEAARIDQGAVATVSREQAELQRQRLAQAMAALNTGRLFPNAYG